MKILLALLLFTAPAYAVLGVYDRVDVDTTTGTADRHISGTMNIYTSSTSTTTPSLFLDGPNGRIAIGGIIGDTSDYEFKMTGRARIFANDLADSLILGPFDGNVKWYSTGNHTYFGATESLNIRFIIGDAVKMVLDKDNGGLVISDTLTDASEKLTVDGNIELPTSGDGIIFSDGSKQTTAISTSVFRAETRQTVLTGSVDASGYADFLTIGASISVDVNASSGEELITAISNGFSSVGNIDYSATFLSTTNVQVPASQTGYIYIDYNSGSPVLDYSTSTVSYAYSAPSAPTAEDWWFSIPLMKMYQYSGSAWVNTPATFIGEWVSDGSAVTSVTTYALRGRYDSGWFAIASNTQYAKNHNIGVNTLLSTLYGGTSSIGTNMGLIEGNTNIGSGGVAGAGLGGHSATSITLTTTDLGAATSMWGSGGTFGRVPIYARIILKRAW